MSTPPGENEGGDTGQASSAAESRVGAGVGGAGGAAASTASAASVASAAAAAPDPGGSKEEQGFVAGTSRRRKRLTLCQEEYRSAIRSGAWERRYAFRLWTVLTPVYVHVCI